eukprot:1600855-Rhodomonas_salina.2
MQDFGKATTMCMRLYGVTGAPQNRSPTAAAVPFGPLEWFIFGGAVELSAQQQHDTSCSCPSKMTIPISCHAHCTWLFAHACSPALQQATSHLLLAHSAAPPTSPHTALALHLGLQVTPTDTHPSTGMAAAEHGIPFCSMQPGTLSGELQVCYLAVFAAGHIRC